MGKTRCMFLYQINVGILAFLLDLKYTRNVKEIVLKLNLQGRTQL